MKLSFEINFSNADSSSLISNSCVFPKIKFWVKVNIFFLGKVNISSFLRLNKLLVSIDFAYTIINITRPLIIQYISVI